MARRSASARPTDGVSGEDVEGRGGVATCRPHTAAMLATIAVAVYEWLGIGILRLAWVNLDLIWTAALVLCGVVVLVMAG
jgi:hypothetical protein